MIITLKLPDAGDKEAAEDYKNDFFSHGESIINGSALLDKMDFEEWLFNTVNNRCIETVHKDWVAETTFFAIDDSGRIVGMISVRHSLDNEFLAQYGGHIGYSVRPCERRKGVAVQMLHKALEFAKSKGIEQAMLGCMADNIPSVRTIEKCGGTLAETKPYTDGEMVSIYHINL